MLYAMYGMHVYMLCVVYMITVYVFIYTSIYNIHTSKAHTSSNTQDPSVHAPPSPHTPPHPPPTPNDPRTRPHLLKRIKAYLKTAGRVAIRQQGHSIPGSLYCNDAAEFESFVSASSGGGLGGSGAGGSGIGGSIGGGSGGVVRGGNSSGALGTATSPVTPTSA